MPKVLLLIWASALLLGCSKSSGTKDTDAGMDTETETGTDTEAGTEPDAGTERDTGTDTEADAGTDASVEPMENQWIEISGGTFTQGSEEDLELDIDYTWYPMPTPEHTVTVPDFSIQKTEVTLGQYNACIAAGVCSDPEAEIPTFCASYNEWNDAERVNHPVDCVSYPQAARYCEWIGGRLPTESEWEYAARSQGKDYARPWGNTEATCEYAALMEENTYGCGTGDVWPVCSFPKGNTEQELCDMVGNVFEITADALHRTYEDAPSDGSAWMEEEDSRCIVRGGSFREPPVYLRTTFRGLGPFLSGLQKGTGRIGFRCAK